MEPRARAHRRVAGQAAGDGRESLALDRRAPCKTGQSMGILTDDMKRVLDEQQLGFIATVTPDGKPNLSPKGTTTAWGDDHLVFADICSPTTIANLRNNSAIEINIVDPVVRKGYRFKGMAIVLSSGEQYDEIE